MQIQPVRIKHKISKGEILLHRRRASRALRGRIPFKVKLNYICSSRANIAVRNLFKNNNHKINTKITKGEIRTRDLTGMSRALLPAELPCHLFSYLIFIAAQLVLI